MWAFSSFVGFFQRDNIHKDSIEMAKVGEEVIVKSNSSSEQGEKVVLMEENKEKEEGQGEGHHPYAFHVSGPRNVSSPNWRDLISSSWLVLNNFFNTFALINISFVVFNY